MRESLNDDDMFRDIRLEGAALEVRNDRVEHLVDTHIFANAVTGMSVIFEPA